MNDVCVCVCVCVCVYLEGAGVCVCVCVCTWAGLVLASCSRELNSRDSSSAVASDAFRSSLMDWTGVKQQQPIRESLATELLVVL